jgi:hypothetical protein
MNKKQFEQKVQATLLKADMLIRVTNNLITKENKFMNYKEPWNNEEDFGYVTVHNYYTETLTNEDIPF